MNENIGAFWKVRELAVSVRVSLAELLREAGVGTSTVHQWKTGQSQPRASTIKRINAAVERLKLKSAE